jgi:hypothetical protein
MDEVSSFNRTGKPNPVPAGMVQVLFAMPAYYTLFGTRKKGRNMKSLWNIDCSVIN